jgi:iron complex outermembrane recepter protein
MSKFTASGTREVTAIDATERRPAGEGKLHSTAEAMHRRGHLVFIFANIALAASAAFARDEQADASDPKLEEVVVTAVRRETTIQETPIAVSAYSGQQLQQAQIHSLNDLIPTSPNIQLGPNYTQANVAIRGIGNSQFVVGSDPGVAIHEDGVYLAQSGLALTDFLDVNRVEVLRGPQGTLFGRNATGGAINIVPNLPTAQLTYGFNESVGVDPAMVQSSAYVSGPLTQSGELRGRLAIEQHYNDGYTRNLEATGPRRLDDTNSFSVRGQIEWLPNEDLTSRLLVEYQHQNDNGAAAFLVGTVTPNAPLPAPMQGAQTGDLTKSEVYANQGVRDLDAITVTSTTDVALAKGDLTVRVSYNNTRQYTLTDGDGTSANFLTTIFPIRVEQYYGEAIYTSPADRPFTYVVGTNAFYDTAWMDVTEGISVFPVSPTNSGDVRTTSFAGFGHADYEFIRGAKLFAGARYTYDHKTIDQFNNFASPQTLLEDDSWRRLTYDGGISYDISSAVTTYVKYATGYKGGGYSLGALAPAFAPEFDQNLEAGLKGTYLDGRLQANLAAFHMKYDNLQVQQVVGFFSRVTNAARATIDGVELESVLRPLERLRLELSGGWLDARFDEFITEDPARAYLGVLNMAGNRLPQAPRFTTSAGIYWDVPVKSGRVTAGGRYDWKSVTYFSEFNLPVTSQGAVGKLDLSVNYVSGDGHWTAGVFGLNVTDERIKSNAVVLPPILGALAVASINPGRQVGLSIGYKF